MKLGRFLLAFIVLVGLLGVNISSTRAETFASYVSGITIQNLTGNTATVRVEYYDQAGNVLDSSTTDTIAAYGVKDYATIPTATGFKGSAIISSDQLVGAVSTLRGDNKGRGAYVAATEGSTTVILPVLMKNWGSSKWNTFFSVQNTGTADADVTVDYAACAGTSNDTATGVKPGAMVTFNQATAACMTDAKVFTSAVITSTQPVAVVVAQESSVVNSALVSSGFTSGDTNPVIPLVNSNNPTTSGWRTAITLFNMGTASTDVTLTYVRTDGTSCTEKQTVPALSSKSFAGNNLIVTPPAGVELTCALGARLVGSAYVTANTTAQPLVATVNQDRGSLSSAYGSMAPAVGTPKVVFSQIQDRNGTASQWSSSFTVFNLSPQSTYVKCTFANATYAPTSGELGSFKAWEDLQGGKIRQSYVGSGECTAYTSNTYTTVDTAAKIVAVVNVRGMGTGLFDLMMSYEGVNVTVP